MITAAARRVSVRLDSNSLPRPTAQKEAKSTLPSQPRSKSKPSSIANNISIPVESETPSVSMLVDKPQPSPKVRQSGLPSIMRSNRDPSDMYRQHYQLDIDAFYLNDKQNQTILNNYYRRMVRQRLPFATQIGSLQLISTAIPSTPLALPPLKQADEQYRSIISVDKPMMIKPTDSIFLEIKKEAEEILEGSLIGKTKSTQPFTSRVQANSLSFMEASGTDAIAGNSKNLRLNSQLHQFAVSRIENEIEVAKQKRSRQRRKRELGVEEVEVKEDEQKFNLYGCFDPRSDEVSLNDTVANSSVYNEIQGDVPAFDRYMERCRQREVEIETQTRMGNDYHDSGDDVDPLSDNESPTKDPDSYFQKIRAKIKLKATRMNREEQRKATNALKAQSEPVIEIRDKFGRVMQKVVAGKPVKVMQERGSESPKRRRKPKKAPPLKRKISFTQAFFKYNNLVVEDPLEHMKKPTLTDLVTIKKMQASDRWPIPEQLINRPEHGNFQLAIDSIMAASYDEKEILEWAHYRQDLPAPNNSQESENEYPLYDSHDSGEDENKFPKPTKLQKKQEGENFKEKQFDKNLINETNFMMEKMRNFPHRTREGEVPFQLGKLKHAQGFIDVQEKLANQQKGAIWSQKLIQNVFEHYCAEMKAAPIPIMNYIISGDNKIRKLSVKNFTLDESQAKALACIIPFIVDIEEMEFSNNQLMDHCSAVLVLGFFQNPSLHKMTITYNFLRASFCKTLTDMIKAQPEKITSLNLMGSIASSDHVEHLCINLEKFKQLVSINFSGNNFNVNCCRIFGNFMMSSYTLRDIDIAHCRISYQGTRYIIDAMNRNTTCRAFNFAYNDLTSTAYEFSIKLASIITRHPALLHIDISKTNLKREEVLFIGISLSNSKTLLSCHLTANELPYYERIFLRSVIAARVQFEIKSLAAKKIVKSNKERNQILQMASGEVYDDQMRVYTQNLRELDLKREGLDLEITDMLHEMDTVASFQDMALDMTLDEIPTNTKIGQLVAKIVERNKEIERTKLELQHIYNKEGPNIKKQIDQMGLEEISLYNFDKYGGKPNSEAMKHDAVDWFEQQKAMKVQRQREKAERIATKEARDRSAGELALMFMGINQIAYELLIENPMTGYMNEIIFSRIIGYEDIEQGTYWVDGTQCWICQKWNKVEIKYHIGDDGPIFAQKVHQIDNMHLMINRCITEGTKKAVDQLRKNYERPAIAELDNVELIQHKDDDSFIAEVEEDLEHTTKFSAGLKTGDLKGMTGLKTFKPKQTHTRLNEVDQKRVTMGASMKSQLEEGKSIKSPRLKSNLEDARTLTLEDEIGIEEESSGLSKVRDSDAETEIVQVENPRQERIDQTNTISPIKLRVESVKKTIFPQNFSAVNEFEPVNLKNSFDYSDPLKEKEKNKFNNRSRIQPLGGQGHNTSHDVTAIKNHFATSKLSPTVSEGELEHQASVISVTEHRRRVRGQPTIISKLIFFEGIVYQIEEEVFSDSDHSSVYTSEDDFETDKMIAKKYKVNNPLLSEVDQINPTFENPSRLVKQNTNSQSIKHENHGRKVYTAEVNQKPPSRLTEDKNDSIGAEDESTRLQIPIEDEKPIPLSSYDQPEAQNSTEHASQKRVTIAPDPNTKKQFLSQKQQDYESRCLPKHYNPQTMEKRVKRFEEMSETMSIDRKKPQQPKGPIQRTQEGSFIGKERSTETDGFKPKEKEIYVVASFNEWMPARMKTLRTLNLEKYPVFDEEAVPKHVFMLDNTVLLYGNMVPPGTHFFYFVKDRGNIFLSPKYDVVRFKNTNIFLNRIIVKRRIKDLDTVHIDRKNDDDEAVFMKDRSVFREFIENTPARLQKAFDEDIGFSKIHKTCKSDPIEMQKICDVLFLYYQQIIDVYHFYIGISSYPTIAMNEFTSFSQKCHFMDNKNINLAALDRILITTNVTTHNYTSSAERDLQRYEFLEIIVRLANAKYKDTHQAPNTVSAIEKLLNENIFPNAKRVDGEHFRKYHCYNVKTNEILKKNESQIKKVYDSFTHSKKRWVTLEECQRYVRNMNLNVSEMSIGPIYAESLCLIIDTVRDQTRPNQMKYVEFLVFICRIAKEHYDGSPYEKEAHYLKLDHLMPTLLKEAKVDPNFLFGEKFEYDIELEKKRKRRNKRKLIKAKRQALAEGKEFDLAAVKGLVPASQDSNRIDTAEHRSQLTRTNDLDMSSDDMIDLDAESTSEAEANQPAFNSGSISPKNELVTSAQGAASIPQSRHTNIRFGDIGSPQSMGSGEVMPYGGTVARMSSTQLTPKKIKASETNQRESSPSKKQRAQGTSTIGSVNVQPTSAQMSQETPVPEMGDEQQQMTETTEAKIIEGLMKPTVRRRQELAEKIKVEPLYVPVDLEHLETQKKLNFSQMIKDHQEKGKVKLSKEYKFEKMKKAIESVGTQNDEFDRDI